MKVRFYDRGGVDWVAIQSGFDGKDEVHRPATEEDGKRYATEYAAFRPPPVVKVEAPAAPASTPPKPLKKHKE